MSEDSLPLANAPVHEQDVVIGGRLRAMRKAQDLRLKHVAEQAGLSVSMLSQIERGISSPSIRVLRNICHALGVDGAALFDERNGNAPAPQAGAGADFVVRLADRKPLSVGGVTK